MDFQCCGWQCLDTDCFIDLSPPKRVTFNQVVTLCTFKRVPKNESRCRLMRSTRARRKSKTRFLRPDITAYTVRDIAFGDHFSSVARRAFLTITDLVAWFIK